MGTRGLAFCASCPISDFGLDGVIGLEELGGPFRTSDFRTSDWSASASHTSRYWTSDFGTSDFGTSDSVQTWDSGLGIWTWDSD